MPPNYLVYCSDLFSILFLCILYTLTHSSIAGFQVVDRDRLGLPGEAHRSSLHCSEDTVDWERDFLSLMRTSTTIWCVSSYNRCIKSPVCKYTLPLAVRTLSRKQLNWDRDLSQEAAAGSQGNEPKNEQQLWWRWPTGLKPKTNF